MQTCNFTHLLDFLSSGEASLTAKSLSRLAMLISYGVKEVLGKLDKVTRRANRDLPSTASGNLWLCGDMTNL